MRFYSLLRFKIVNLDMSS